MDYNLKITKTDCRVTGSTHYSVGYDPNFPEGDGEVISSFKTSRIENLVERLSEQVEVARKRGDCLKINLDDNDFSDSEKSEFVEMVGV